MKHNTKNWYRLDNAATIYPTVKTRSWMAMFRVSAVLNEDIDKSVLEKALQNTLRRLPTFGVCVKRGLFWFYLEELHGTPPIDDDVANPCLPIDAKKNKKFLFKVRYYGGRIALEFFHVLSDGTGGMIFLKTLVGEYIRLKYGADVDYGYGVLDCACPPTPAEREDSFIRYAKAISVPRGEKSSYSLTGQREKGFLNIITGVADTDKLLEAAHRYDVSLTQYLTACMIESILAIQKSDKRISERKKPVKICVPVNLRSLFQSETVRNFASYVNPGIEGAYGEYTFAEIASAVKHYMYLEVTPQKMCAKFSGNVDAQRKALLKAAPLFIKVPILKLIYLATGDIQTASLMSNLGKIDLPEGLKHYVNRFDFQVGPLYQNPVMCAVASYNGKTNINFTRTLRSAEVERGVFTRLVADGVPVTVESNLRERSLCK